MSPQNHSGRMDSKSIHSTIDLPPGIPGVSKNQIFFTKKLLNSCAKIDLKLHKLRKTLKIEKKSWKTLFSEAFSNFLQFRANFRPSSTQSWKICWIVFFGYKISANKTNLITLESLSLRITYRQHCGWKKRTPCLRRLVCHFCRMYFSNTQLTEIFSEASYLSWDLFWNINRNHIAKICFLICRVQGPNVSTTPITAMGCRQCLPLSVVQLKGSLLFSPIQILFIIFFHLMFESEVGFYRSWKKH